jgi:hypothetical protein
MVIRAFGGAEIANCLPRSNSLTAFGLLFLSASVAHSEWNSNVALSAAAASTSVSEKFEKWAFQRAPVTQTGTAWPEPTDQSGWSDIVRRLVYYEVRSLVKLTK